MICEYHRPNNINDALQLLSRTTIKTFPLGGGTVLSQYKGLEDIAVVDLQNLDLDKITLDQGIVSIGAFVTLQQLLEFTDEPAYRNAIELDSSLNTRHRATIAGKLITADGRSPFATLMLALNVKLIWMPGEREIPYSTWLSQRETQRQDGIITRVIYSPADKINFDQVARTRYDKPIVCAAQCRWSSIELRISIGGFGKFPTIFFSGSPEDYSADDCILSLNDMDDEWATSTYRKQVVSTLINRMLNNGGTNID